MINDPRLEKYLTRLEQALKPFPVSDRADIITEIKSHVLSAMSTDSSQQLDSVLRALGEPETVANRYLIERGLKPTKPPISPIVKWIVIGFMGSFAMVLIFIGVVISHFTPLLQVDDNKDHVSLFGGLIEVNGNHGKFRIKGINNDFVGNTIEGTAEVLPDQKISIKFGNGKFDVINSNSTKFSWNCVTHDPTLKAFNPPSNPKDLALDFSDLLEVKCELSVPSQAKIFLSGSNGKLEISQPHFDLNVEMGNGKIDFQPDASHLYNYKLSVKNGKTDEFISSDDPKAHAIIMEITNGKISRTE